MRIHSVIVDNFRAIEHLDTGELPERGVIIIHGDNEAGKSTILDAIDLVLRERSSSKKKEVKAVAPVGRDAGPEVCLEATVGETRFRIHKRWLKSPLAKLDVITPKPANYTGREAEDTLRDILAEHMDRELAQTLFLRQGQLDPGLQAAGILVVLVDERPEEVTDMQRSVRGEVIASTFDRPPSEHTAVAELAIERAKRLVEMGQDVVVLLDSITRLGRAYNNSSPASGRILSGGVDSNALYPPKRFLGAARNIEEGGSLTIIATAMVETGSAGDTVIFEEFKGTGNAELKLDRKIAERRVFPAVDVNPSGTRKDELLMSPEEARVMHKLRRILSALDPQQSIDMLIKQLKKTKSNGEFLMGVAKSAPMTADQNEEDYV